MGAGGLMSLYVKFLNSSSASGISTKYYLSRKRKGDSDTTAYKSKQQFTKVFYAFGRFLGKTICGISSYIV
jgi:hypothetical protein